jgi:hypothetical protein
MGYRDYSTAKAHIVDATGHGDFTTISAALSAASAGQVIFVRPGIYTENPTLKADVDICAFIANAVSQNVTINGKCSYSGSGDVAISGICLQTNSDYALEVTGSSASVVSLINCSINMTNNAGIHLSSSSSSAGIGLSFCIGNSNSGETLFVVSGAGSLGIVQTQIGGTPSSTASTFSSSGTLDIYYSTINSPITTSGSSSVAAKYCYFQPGIDANGLIFGGSGSIHQIWHCQIGCQLVINNTMTVVESLVNSGQTNAITGSGTLLYGNIVFIQSSGNNVTTETPLTKI